MIYKQTKLGTCVNQWWYNRSHRSCDCNFYDGVLGVVYKICVICDNWVFGSLESNQRIGKFLNL